MCRLTSYLEMLERGEISLSLAAKIVGLTVEELIEEAIRRGVKIFDVEGDVEEILASHHGEG